MKIIECGFRLGAILLCGVGAVGELSAAEASKEPPRTLVSRQGKLLEDISDGGILEGIHGINNISGPWVGRRGEVVPDTLSILDARFTLKTALKEHDVLVALQEAFLSRYFSERPIKVIGSQFRYPGSSFSVVYYQDGWLGQFSLSLRDTEDGFEAWIVDHAQAHKGLNEEQFEGMDVKETLERARDEREEIRREAEESVRAARENSIAEGSAGQPATRSQSKPDGSQKPQPEPEERSR